MDDGEVLSRGRWNGDARDPFGRRERRKEREGKMADRIAKFGAVRSVPGIDGIESFEFRDPGAVNHTDEFESGIGDGPSTIREADQRQHRTRRPDLGIRGARGFQSGERKNNVANRARANQKPTTGDKIACPTNG